MTVPVIGQRKPEPPKSVRPLYGFRHQHDARCVGVPDAHFIAHFDGDMILREMELQMAAMCVERAA